MAREQHEATLPSSAGCLHFNGAGGNVAAGKYNDGQPHRRQELADRVATAMGEAWADAKANRQPAVAADVGWFIEPVSLPLSPRLEGEEVEGQQLAIIADESADEWERLRTARDVVYARRVRAGRSIDLTCLRIGPARLISMPGELFVEYQLEAQRLAAENGAVSMMAAYGDYGPGYIGTAASYDYGNPPRYRRHLGCFLLKAPAIPLLLTGPLCYETGVPSRVSAGAEPVLLAALEALLRRARLGGSAAVAPHHI